MKKTIAENDRLQEERYKAYQDYFGDNWDDFESHWMAEDRTPEETVEILGDYGLIDYCDYCKQYYWIERDFGVYSCPYCNHLGNYSAPDNVSALQKIQEERWEQRTNR